MTQRLEIHPTHPQARRVGQVAELLRGGGVVVYPTDTAYALACHLGDKAALDRIVRLRQLDKKHQFTLACRDLSELGVYARVDNAGYRLLRRLTPGPYTFVMKATRDVPRRLLHPKRKTIGLRVPDNVIAREILEGVGEPLMTTTMQLPGQDEALGDPYDIFEAVGRQVDLVVDGGILGTDVSTVLDLTDGAPQIIRQGLGELDL
ncbi:MAG: L-threonylcarbamoyladenylate synthase [Pseudomonadota bacterium]